MGSCLATERFYLKLAADGARRENFGEDSKYEYDGECGGNVVFPLRPCGGGAAMRKLFVKSGVLLFCTAVLATGMSSLPGDEAAKVDAYVRGEMQKERIPGLALGVYRDGTILKAEGYGIANLEWDVPVKPDTIFQSGSVGKQFAATAVMMLVEEGKVGLDDPVQKYFSDAPDAWKGIKIRNLLSHTSGLSEYENGPRTKPDGPFYLRLDMSEDELYKRITAMPLDFQPGEDWSYRNTNYVLLGILIHKVTGKFYGDYLQERIFKPLGMTTTRIISDADIIPHRAAGYELVQGQLKNQEWVSPTFNSTADGTLYFTVLDLEKWDAALYSEKLLKRSSLEQMWTVMKLNNGQPNKANYGFAWDIKQINGHKVMEHGGAWQGFTCHIARYVDDQLTVVVLTNLDAGHAQPNKIARTVAGLYVPELMPVEAKPIEDKEPQVTRLVRSVLQEFGDEKADPERFTLELRAKLFPEQAQGISDYLKEQGPLKSLELIKRGEEEDKRSYKYRASYGLMSLFLSIQLTKDNKIAVLDFSDE
jgi:CubicO group peptidase (beta-lactamase class C family)